MCYFEVSLLGSNPVKQQLTVHRSFFSQGNQMSLSMARHIIDLEAVFNAWVNIQFIQGCSLPASHYGFPTRFMLTLSLPEKEPNTILMIYETFVSPSTI